MKKLKTVFSLLLALFALLSALAAASCGAPDGDGSAQSAPSQDPGLSGGPDGTSSEHTGPVFRDADYGGETFSVYMRSSKAKHYAGLYIYCPENATDLVNEQAAVRNQRVEEKYNISFSFTEADYPQDTVKKDLAAGDLPYDIVLAQRSSLGGLAYEGLLRNFNDLDVDFTTGWWDKNACREYGDAGKLFIMPNDVSVANLAGCRLWWFNKAVLEDFRLTSPYEYAARNEWTIDVFFQMIKSVSAPGADGQIGIYGMIKEECDHLLTGIGSFRVEVDEAGDLVCRIGTDYAEKTQDFLDKYKAIISDPSVSIDYGTAAGLDALNSSKYIDQFYHARALFSEGHFLFTQTTMNGSLEAFGESEKGIGAVMNPKYDSDQPEYYHQMDALFPIWTIPDDPSADVEMLGNVMDYWAYVSSSTVMEAYYELTLKTKRASDPDMALMLDTVKGSIRYYITDLFPADISPLITASYNRSVSAAWAALKTKIPNDLKKVQDKILAID